MKLVQWVKLWIENRRNEENGQPESKKMQSSLDGFMDQARYKPRFWTTIKGGKRKMQCQRCGYKGPVISWEIDGFVQGVDCPKICNLLGGKLVGKPM